MAKSGSFIKSFSQDLIEKLQANKLYQDKILPDIHSGAVFPAIRNNRIDFYHAGGKLFSFSGEFSTHIKYASVFTYEKDYLSESNFNDATPITNFVEGYELIKENCALYSKVEARGVARLYQNSSFANCNDDVVVLDTEASLKSLPEEEVFDDLIPEITDKPKKKKRKQDRIDVLLYNKKTKTLRFYEAKDFSNKELWAKEGSSPKVYDQLTRYNKQLNTRNPELLKAYVQYVEIARTVFGLSKESLPTPERLEEKTVLLLFGYDKKQADKIEELLVQDGSLKGLSLRMKGDTTDKNYTANAIWKNVKQL